MTVRTSGVRQQSIWASVVSVDAQNLRGWLLGLGFTEDLLIPGERKDLIHHCQLDWPEGGRVLLSGYGRAPHAVPAGDELVARRHRRPGRGDGARTRLGSDGRP